jgi:hypothetical protein
VMFDLELGQQGLQGLRVIGQVHVVHLKRADTAWQWHR